MNEDLPVSKDNIFDTSLTLMYQTEDLVSKTLGVSVGSVNGLLYYYNKDKLYLESSRIGKMHHLILYRQYFDEELEKLNEKSLEEQNEELYKIMENQITSYSYDVQHEVRCRANGYENLISLYKDELLYFKGSF